VESAFVFYRFGQSKHIHGIFQVIQFLRAYRLKARVATLTVILEYFAFQLW
jgi:hypothetical protein